MYNNHIYLECIPISGSKFQQYKNCNYFCTNLIVVWGPFLCLEFINCLSLKVVDLHPRSTVLFPTMDNRLTLVILMASSLAKFWNTYYCPPDTSLFILDKNIESQVPFHHSHLEIHLQPNIFFLPLALFSYCIYKGNDLQHWLPVRITLGSVFQLWGMVQTVCTHVSLPFTLYESLI